MCTEFHAAGMVQAPFGLQGFGTKSIFLDVYAVDQLPKEKIAQDRWLLIANCCPIERPGKHWVCIYGDKSTGIEFFDSFGLSPVKYDGKIAQFFYAQGCTEKTDVKYNATHLQNLDTDVCGHYCILFSRLRAIGKDMTTIVEWLCQLNRDSIVKRIVNTGFDEDSIIYEMISIFRQ